MSPSRTLGFAMALFTLLFTAAALADRATAPSRDEAPRRIEPPQRLQPPTRIESPRPARVAPVQHLITVRVRSIVTGRDAQQRMLITASGAELRIAAGDIGGIGREAPAVAPVRPVRPAQPNQPRPPVGVERESRTADPPQPLRPDRPARPGEPVRPIGPVAPAQPRPQPQVEVAPELRSLAEARPTIARIRTVQLYARTVRQDPRARQTHIVLASGGRVSIPTADVAATEAVEDRPDRRLTTADELEDPIFRTPAERLGTMRVQPRARLTELPQRPIAVTAGDGGRYVTLHGENLDRITRAVALRDGRPDRHVEVILGAPHAASRAVELRTGTQATEGEVTVRFYAGRQLLDGTVSLQVKHSDLLAVLDERVRFIGPGRLIPTEDREDVTFYSVWPEMDSPHVRTNMLRRASQVFVANGTHLNRIRMGIAGSGQVRVRIIDHAGGQGLLNQTVAIAAGNATTLDLANPIALTPGRAYIIELSHDSATGRFVVHGSDRASDYPWSHAFFQRFATSNLNMILGTNLMLELTGWWADKPDHLKSPPPRPGQKALLILLENGGVDLSYLNGLDELVPDITIATCGSFSFELAPGETLLSKIAGLLSLGIHCMNPANWQTRKLTFEEWWTPVSDYILETINNAITEAVDRTTPHTYDHVVRLQDGNFTPQRVLEELEALSPDYVVDIHVLAHGGDGFFVGDFHTYFDADSFFRPLQQARVTAQTPLHLRAVYQMNCVSGTLIDTWRESGAGVVNGTSELYNNWMPTQYYHFLHHWLRGATFRQSVERSFDEARPYFNVIYHATPEKIEESRHEIHGQANMRMTSP